MSDGKRLERPRRTPCQSEIAEAGNPRRIGDRQRRSPVELHVHAMTDMTHPPGEHPPSDMSGRISTTETVPIDEPGAGTGPAPGAVVHIDRGQSGTPRPVKCPVGAG